MILHTQNLQHVARRVAGVPNELSIHLQVQRHLALTRAAAPLAGSIKTRAPTQSTPHGEPGRGTDRIGPQGAVVDVDDTIDSSAAHRKCPHLQRSSSHHRAQRASLQDAVANSMPPMAHMASLAKDALLTLARGKSREQAEEAEAAPVDESATSEVNTDTLEALAQLLCHKKPGGIVSHGLMDAHMSMFNRTLGQAAKNARRGPRGASRTKASHQVLSAEHQASTPPE